MSVSAPDPNLKKCRWCAEMIQADATICKHCGRSINRTLEISQQLGKVGASMQSLGCLMTLLISIPICICIAVYLFSQQ